MTDEPVFIKSGDQKSETVKPGRLYRTKIKSEKIEAIVAELDPKAESRWYQHSGEELHLVIEGKMEYTVGENTYKLSKGDILWHKSNLRHRARNTSSKKVKYITVGTPPTFMISDL
jgi:quercetin dioxygenase-like cupin family protein